MSGSERREPRSRDEIQERILWLRTEVQHCMKQIAFDSKHDRVYAVATTAAAMQRHKDEEKALLWVLGDERRGPYAD